MNTRFLLATVLSLFLMPALAADPATDGRISIQAPMNGAVVKASDTVMISYDADVGTRGDHLHLYLDGKRIDILRKLKGSAEVGMLPPGKHEICLTVNTKSHAPTGVKECVDVTSK